MPGDLKVIGEQPMCADARIDEWAADFKAHKPEPPTRFRHHLHARRRHPEELNTDLLAFIKA